MRIALELPADFRVYTQGEEEVALWPASTPERPAVLCAWGRLVAAAGEDTWLWRPLLEVDLGGRSLEVSPPAEGATDSGWRFVEVAARVLEDGELAEERLAIVYRFDEWRGAVLVRAFDPARFAELAPALRAALSRARPDWRGDGEIICLAQLFEGPA